MSTSTKRPLADALRDAEEFRAKFAGCFERWEIAGSVRRRKPDVGDVEHVVIPLKPQSIWRRLEALTWNAGDLFADASAPFTKHVYPDGSNRWGEKYRGVDFKGFAHEIFLADEKNYGAILAIRTGPADYSKMLVMALAARGLKQEGGYVIHRGEVASVPNETVYFSFCGLKYCEPSQRKTGV